jgi:hypothetical protein
MRSTKTLMEVTSLVASTAVMDISRSKQQNLSYVAHVEREELEIVTLHCLVRPQSGDGS